MTTMASRLRESRMELEVLLERKGVRVADAAGQLDSLAAALERGVPNAPCPSADRRLVGECVLDSLESRGIAATPRELRSLHEWVVAGLAARISELEVANRSAASVEERLRFILPNARIMVIEIDRELRIRWVYDPRGDRQEMIGVSLHEIDHPALTEQIAAIVERVVRTGFGERAEFSPPNDEGRIEHVLGSFEPMRDASGAISGVLVAATEVTELKEAGIALAQSVAFREQMLAVLAHDLKNPLTSVLALSRLYASSEQVPPHVRRALSQIDRASQRMVELIVTLLDFSAARFGRALPVTRIACGLEETAQSVIDELRGSSPERTIVLRVDGNTHGAWDAARMAQILSNLVGNALAHGTACEPVVVDLEGSEGQVLIRVQNSGAPIAPDMMPVLFEPFRRGGNPGEGPQGLGLGLYIVQEIVKAHGGAIDVESTPERGTTFTVTLPRCEATVAPGPIPIS